MSVQKTLFGRLSDGQEVYCYTIDDGALQAAVLDYGVTVQALCYGGKDVALGYDTIEEYCVRGGYLGATVGRYANRIADGKFVLNGKQYDVGCNEKGRGHLHGGTRGYDKYVWAAEIVGDNAVRFSRVSPDGEEGYPGTLTLAVTVTVENATLCFSYMATTDADTVVNLTNHTYFNLNGYDGDTVLNHTLRIPADYMTPVDDKLIPTGELRDVTGTAFDFRLGKTIGQDIASDDPQVAMCRGFDHNFVLGQTRETRVAACVTSPSTGIGMEVVTDLPAVQLYTACGLSVPQGKGGVPMVRYGALCLETQFSPDTPNRPEFPSCVLKAGETFRSETSYRFFAN